MTLFKYTGTTGTLELRWMSTTYASGQFPLSNNEEYIRNTIMIPANCNDYIINMFDSSSDIQCDETLNLIPIDPAFEGRWDFQFYTFTEYDDNRPQPMYAYLQGQSGYSHGYIKNNNLLQAGTNHAGTDLEPGYTPTFYAFDYLDTVSPNPNGGAYFKSLFVPVKSSGTSFGITSQEVNVQQSGNDNFEYNIGFLNFGDGSGSDTNSTFQVYDGSNWVYVNVTGRWAKGIYTWNSGTSQYDWSTLTYDKKSQVLVAEEIMNNQSKTITTFSGTTALSSINKNFSGSSKSKYINPCCRMLDTDGKKYMMMRSTFDIMNDEWNAQWVEVFYDVPSTVTSNTSSSVVNIGTNRNQSTNINFPD